MQQKALPNGEVFCMIVLVVARENLRHEHTTLLSGRVLCLTKNQCHDNFFSISKNAKSHNSRRPFRRPLVQTIHRTAYKKFPYGG